MVTTAMPQQQMAQVIGQKQMIQQRPGAPLVIGPLGRCVLSNQGVNVSGQQIITNQPKSPSVSIAGQPTQIISSPTQLRFSGPHTFVTNTGQIFTAGNPAMLNQFHSVVQQQNLPQQML